MKSGEIMISSVDDRAAVAAILVKNGYAVIPVKIKVGSTRKTFLRYMDADDFDKMPADNTTENMEEDKEDTVLEDTPVSALTEGLETGEDDYFVGVSDQEQQKGF